MSSLIALVFFLLATVKGVNLLFFAENGVCDTSKEDFLVCSDLPQHRCCQSQQKSFCGTSILQYLNNSTEHYVVAKGFCDINGTHDSVRDYPGFSNCIGIPKDDSSDKCSSFWEPIADGNMVSGRGDQEMDCQVPDKMVYHDGTVMRNIHLPDGSFPDAMEHYQAKNYKDLATFPAWNGLDTDTDGWQAMRKFGLLDGT